MRVAYCTRLHVAVKGRAPVGLRIRSTGRRIGRWPQRATLGASDARPCRAAASQRRLAVEKDQHTPPLSSAILSGRARALERPQGFPLESSSATSAIARAHKLKGEPKSTPRAAQRPRKKPARAP